MKKIIFAFLTIITMMLCIASPLFIKPLKANAAIPTFVNEPQPIFEDMWSEPINNENYVYSYNKLLSYFTNTYTNTIPNSANYFSMTYKQKTPSSYDYQNMCFWYDSADVSIDGNHIVIQNMVNGSIHSQCTYDNVDVYQYGLSKVDFDFDTFTFQFWDRSGGTYNLRYLYQASWPVTDIWNVYTNISELNNSNTLNVLVDFSPDLIGNVDRQITALDGTKSMRKDLAMEVINQSNFPIQYDMRIYKVNQSSSRDWSLNPETFATQFDSDSVSYDDDPVFIYYKNEWVYTTNYDSESTFWDLEPVKENKGASWHYLAANSQDIVLFNFTQINLDENVDYYVEVRAVRNDYGCSSEKIVYSASDDPADSEYKQIQGDDIEIVYHEQFKMINYSDVVYNPNEDSNGVLPYNGKNGIVSRNTYQYGRNARDNGNGNIDYTARNLYTDQNSWYNQQYHRVVSNHTSTASSGSVPSNITNLFDSFMKFVSYVFLRFPANMQTIYVYGFVSIIVLGIVLKVIK